MSPLTPYQKRLLWASRLLKDVMHTLGSDAGVVWWREHRVLITRSLNGAQREWNAEKARLLLDQEGQAVSHDTL